MANVGDVIADRYVLEERIGSGGMGVVWRAWDTELGRQVAVKCARLADEQATSRLRTEASNAAALNHGHIVLVFDIVDDGATCWVVMEYVPARSLAQWMRTEGRLPLDQVASIGWQVAEALAEVHRNGLVHGDVSPENILVTEQGIAKLADFGISRALWSEVTMTPMAGLLGKPRYLPPEVARGGAAVRESDLFSLGATLFKAIEGESPFGEADNPVVYVDRSRRGEIAEPRHAERLTDPLTALLHCEPGSRPAAAEIARVFRSIAPALDDEPSWAVPSRAGEAGEVPSPGRRPSSPDEESWKPPHLDADRVSSVVPRNHPPVEAPRRPTSVAYRRPLLLGSLGLAALAALYLITVPLRPGAAEPEPSRSPTPATPGVGPAVVADPRTADPCSVLSAGSLGRFGETDLDPHYGNFDRCDVLILRDSDMIAEVEAQFLAPGVEPETEAQAKRVGAVTVFREPLDGDECDRLIRLADGTVLDISANREGDGAPDLCQVADAAADHAVRVLNRGPVRPRHATPAPGSLLTVDACALLDARALARFPGVNATEPDIGFGHFQCRWNSTVADAWIDLRFDQGQPLTAGDGQPTELAGRRSYVRPGFEGDDSCSVTIVQRTVHPAEGADIAETVLLTVAGPGSKEELCDQAKEFGRLAAAHMPRP